MHRDEHVQRDRDRAGRLRRSRASRYELNVKAAELAKEAARESPRSATAAALRRRRNRPDGQDALALAQSRRSIVSRRHVRSSEGRVRRAGARPARWRRRRAARRDDLRHAQREGRARRDRRGLRVAQGAHARDDLGDDHRSERTHAVGTNRRCVLAIRDARAPALGRRELRARRGARCARTWSASRATRTYSSARTRTRDCRTRSRRPDTTRCRSKPPRSSASWPSDGLREHRRRLLRHDARSHSRHRASRRRNSLRARRRSRDHVTRFSGLETYTIAQDSNFTMIGERTNVTGSAKFAELDSQRRLHEGARGRARSSARRREHPRREHGRGNARRRRIDDAHSSTSSPPSPRSRACRS